MAPRIKIAVLMGGKTPEHEISLISGREVVRNLDKDKYEVVPVVISRDGKKWKYISPNTLLSLPDPLELKDAQKNLISDNKGKMLSGARDLRGEVEVVFIAMHGPFGEDGTVQGMLEMEGLSYTGSGVLASALAMNKVIFRRLLKGEGITIPEYVLVKDKKTTFDQVVGELGKPPFFVKPCDQGSSVGASRVRGKRDFSKALSEAFKYGDTVLVDEYLDGKELTCAVIGNNEERVLPLVEIVPKKGDFFNYDSKYLEGGAEEIVPARVSGEVVKKVHNTAVQVYNLLGCEGFSRVDFIMKEDKPVVLEVNTIPGLTPMSLFPKAAKAAGISYKELLDKLVNYAI